MILIKVFGQYNIQNPPDAPDNIRGSLYFETFTRLTWSGALGWIIFASVHGYGGFINSFLSHPYWQPLARLSYSLYLIHPTVMLFMLGSAKSSTFMSDWNFIYMFWGDLGYSLTISIFLVLAFELPVPILEGFIFKSSKYIMFF